MPRPPEEINAEISPREFELLVRDYLMNLGKELNTFTALHDVKIHRVDGEYQIDVFAEFDFLGASFKVLVECKRYKNKVKREVVQLLFDKLRATGSHKGLIFSTSGFQEGAITFAKEHGIALIRVIEGKYNYFTKSSGHPNFQPPRWADTPKYVGEYFNDKYIAYLQDGHLEPLSEFLFD
jgi:restriction system protein